MRTQIILKTVDYKGKVTNKVYHVQWGNGYVMPQIAMAFFISAELGTQRNKINRIINRNRTILHNLVIPNIDVEITHEFNNTVVYENCAYNKDWFKRDLEEQPQLIKTAIAEGKPILSYDFDVENAEECMWFYGDNDSGLMVIEIREVVGNSDSNSLNDYDIKVGFVRNSSSKRSKPRVTDIVGFLRNDRNYDSELNRMFDIFCKHYEIKQIRK